MTTSLPSPLGGQAPAEIPLAMSPLARVLAQVRFSSVLKIDSKEGVAPLQEEIRSHYPLLEQVLSQQLHIDMTPGGGGIRPITNNVWRFSDAEHGLVLSLTSDTLTLEARHYPGRAAFLDRWADALVRVERVFAPSLALRTGARYLNRLTGESLDRLPAQPHRGSPARSAGTRDPSDKRSEPPGRRRGAHVAMGNTPGQRDH